MKLKFLSVALGIALSATVMSASAQKTFTEGVVTYKTNTNGQEGEVKEYFRADSVAGISNQGPAKIKILADANQKYFAIVVDVAAFNVKKVAILNADEIEQMTNALPALTFAPGTETKQISGFNCKKIVATDTKTKKTYDVWITNDVALPSIAIPKYYSSVGGFPVQYTGFQQGKEVNITIVSITSDKAPAGTYSFSSDFDKISLDDLKAMSGGH